MASDGVPASLLIVIDGCWWASGEKRGCLLMGATSLPLKGLGVWSNRMLVKACVHVFLLFHNHKRMYPPSGGGVFTALSAAQVPWLLRRLVIFGSSFGENGNACRLLFLWVVLLHWNAGTCFICGFFFLIWFCKLLHHFFHFYAELVPA